MSCFEATAIEAIAAVAGPGTAGGVVARCSGPDALETPEEHQMQGGAFLTGESIHSKVGLRICQKAWSDDLSFHVGSNDS